MAGGQERILRDRIRSIQATKKITRAMELIAGSRIVKAQQRVHAAMPYSEKITEVVADLAAAGAAKDSPLLAGRDVVNTTCYVAINGDRGLCGGYNAGIQRATEGEVKADSLAGRDYLIVPVGRKAGRYFRFRGYRLGEGFEGFSGAPTAGRHPRRRGRPATTSSSPIPPRCSTCCCRATSRRASTPPCSTPRPRSTPPRSGR